MGDDATVSSCSHWSVFDSLLGCLVQVRRVLRAEFRFCQVDTLVSRNLEAEMIPNLSLLHLLCI